jgi:hypothetical protein
MRTERLDAVIAELGIAPDILKVDTEGHDARVLKGLGDRLKSIPVIFAEVLFTNEAYEGQDRWFQVLEVLQQTHDFKGINTAANSRGELQAGNVLFFLRK